MPEATTLYSVTGVVLVGLVAWVAMVLKQAKEPWARPAPEEPAQELDSPEEKKDEGAKLDADDTARATPVALSEGRQKAAAPDEKKDEGEAAAEEEEAAKKEEA